jgi:precorrin-4/cobalt-precorrin-4 C11-methyltransferase
MKTAKGGTAKKKATVYFIGAGPGDPELITVKGRKILELADIVIYAGSLVNPAVLEGLKAAVYDSAPMHLDEIMALMKGAADKGLSVARLHTGDTAFYSAVSEQIERLRALKIAYEVVPGVSSASAGAAVLGQELTIPEVSQTVIFTRLGGRTPVPEDEALAGLARHRASMVVYLSAGMIEKVVEELLAGYPGETPCVVVEKASWPGQKIVRGSLKEIAARVKKAGIEKTALIYVGDALRASDADLGKKSRLYDKAFRHGYRK